MPLVKRTVEPKHISRVVVEKGIDNDLECVSNSTLANMVRQLSSLSAHAEDLFTELYHETCYSFSRVSQLNDRVERLKIKITELNHTFEEVSLQDINTRKPFKSSVVKDNQIVTFDTRPIAVAVTYQQCDPAPPLHKLNVFREDGKDSMKFYTDPEHFFEQWCQQMMAKDLELQSKKHRQRNRKPRQNKPVGTIRMPKSHAEELSAMRHGPELHDALRKTQSAGNKASSNGNRLSGGDVQQSTVRPTQSTHTPEYGAALADYTLNNGTAGLAVHATKEPITVEQQLPRSVGMIQQQNVISDSGYWSPKNYNYNNSDYQVPTTRRPPDLERTWSNSARPMVPPPAPPPSVTDRERMLQNSGYPPERQPPGVIVASPARVSVVRDNLPPPPPAPSSVLESQPQHFSGVEYTLQSEAMLAPAYDVTQNSDFDLPPPPMPPPYDDMPAGPPSPDLPAIPSANFSGSYPQLDMAESPLPLPPEEVNFNVMVVPPPPPPLVESEQISAKVDGQIGNGVDDSFDRLQPDSASMSSEASSLAAKSVTETASEAPVRDHRSDLLDAIRKGIQLRKVEEHQQRFEQKKGTTGKLDVQTIMEAAFERRRRAIEENDSDRDDDEGDWDDEA